MIQKKDSREEKLTAIPFITEDGEVTNMYVLEDTVLQGVHYILVTDDLSEDGEEAFVTILREEKEIMDELNSNEEYSTYQLVEDETELSAIIRVFAELMDDVEFEV